MRTKLVLIGTIGMITVLSYSCQKADISDLVLYPENARLKMTYYVNSLNSEKSLGIIEEFEYDDNGKLIRSSSPIYQKEIRIGEYSYKFFDYNSSDQLVKVMNYQNCGYCPSGFANLTNSIIYYTNDGKKEKELIEGSNGELIEYKTFEYKNDELIYIRKFNNKNELESYVEYQYDQIGNLIKESSYGYDGKCVSYTINTYSGLLQIKSEIYNNYTNSKIREINRTFDKNNNLIILQSIELSTYSSLASYIMRYEYFK